MKSYHFLIAAFLLLSPVIFSQSLFVNEVMPSNRKFVTDEDGDYSDWIELYNASSTKINLQGYGLSDDIDEPFKWVFPNCEIDPQNFFFLFASGKNRLSFVGWDETIVNWGDIWKYKTFSSAPPSNWKAFDFDDASWLSGKSGLGHGDGDDSTEVGNVVSLFMRKDFDISDTSNVLKLYFHADYDDAFVAYLNGVEIARSNIGTPGVAPLWDAYSDQAREAEIYQGGSPEAFGVNQFKNLLRPGKNVLAIEVHNTINSSDMSIIPFLTLGLKNRLANSRSLSPFLTIPKGSIHTNFRLNATGDTVMLTTPTGTTLDFVKIKDFPRDLSFGRKPDGGTTFLMFPQPTPGLPNTTPGYELDTKVPSFSAKSGFYSDPFYLIMLPFIQGDSIYYTTDGSDPTTKSKLYSSQILINKTTVVKAKSFRSGTVPSPIETQSYIFEQHAIPVISISTEPGNFFDPDTGIYELGPSYETSYPYFGANFWKDWERPVHLEFFEPDGSNKYISDAGVKIYGAWSRAKPEKSMAFFARGIYGNSKFEYKFFPDQPYTEYESFVLRNSGNDWEYTMLRDAIMQGLLKNTGLDLLAYRPCAVYINGEYWGILNLREKVNENYLALHHNIKASDIDLLDSAGTVLSGDNLHYNALKTFITNNDLSNNSNYQYVTTQMDVDDFISYMSAEIYFDNTDWPANNIKFWRPRTPDGKWRWIVFDTDFGFGLYSTGYSNNTLEFATAPNSSNYANVPWSTLFLRKLLQNENFKYNFINRFADYTNSIFRASEVIKEIRSKKAGIEPEINNHLDRWGQSYDNWTYQLKRMEDFATRRIAYMQQFYKDKFGLTGMVDVNVSMNKKYAGRIKFNSLTISDSSWSGKYFLGVPVEVTAIANPGYHFVRWANIASDSNYYKVTLEGDFNFTAVFEKDASNTIAVNEINYNAPLDFECEDWVELINNADNAIDMSGWKFMDEDDTHSYIIPSGTIVQPGAFLVLCKDKSKFSALYPSVTNRVGNFSFGLGNGGELVRIFDNTGKLIDSLTYDNKNSWPSEPDGLGATLALKNPMLDNSLPSNWAASLNHGTPGRSNNDVYTGVDESGKTDVQKQFTLMQNYPNPFNPNTNFGFRIPVAAGGSNSGKRGQVALVTLKVYDILGNEIATLVNEGLPAGEYKINFNASHLASGVYFYQLRSGTFVDTKKFILMK